MTKRSIRAQIKKPKAMGNLRAKTRAFRATAKRHVNKRELEWAAQDPPPQRGRHGKMIHNPTERSDGAHRATEEGSFERRGGRERAERKGAPPLAAVRGSTRHRKPRPHGSVGRRALRGR